MLRKAGVVVIVAVLLALVAPVASPVQISYVTSDSMEPTIGTNDGYVLVPTGEVIPGEIITFYSEERDGYVTHRVVGTTADGYLTQGDNNPSTDQAAGSPPVERDAIVGQVLTVGGKIVLIPQLGAVIGLLRANWMLMFTLAGLYILVQAFRGSNVAAGAVDKRSVLYSRQVVVPTLLMTIVASVLLISAGATHTELTYSVTETGGEDPRVLSVGENTTVPLETSIAKTPLTRVLIETEGMTIINRSRAGPTEATNATAAAGDNRQSGLFGTVRQQFVTTTSMTLEAEIPAQAQLGGHTTEVNIYSYPATLPMGVLTQLHAIHPWLAALGSVLVVAAPSYVLYCLLIDTTTPIRGTRRRWLHRLRGR
jgi:signal peptidase I, archaeal type